ncbi:MAG: thioredoxin [Bacteroidetes bacterium]|nr:thioredoxin [Bacteroidota bacterium]MBU1679740.1 thioredoxin [Bacteroidota bacterium]MBU2506268.1 thioredoxin [Bacteroidota bacterium]
MPFTFTDDNFEQEAIKSEVPVLVDFWAAWCGPCRMIATVIEELAKEYDGKVKVGKLDIDANQQTAIKFGVRSIPTVLLFKDGQVRETIIGAVPKQQFVDKISTVL